MAHFNLEYYRTFYFVAKFGNMTRAAEALYVSQPAVSRAIQNLEASLNATLFSRKSHGMELTPEGKALYEHVDAAFELLTNGERQVANTTALKCQVLRIAATETPLYHYLLPKMETFRKTHPDARFLFSGSSSADTISLLLRGQADLALAVSPLPDMDLSELCVIDGPVFHDILVAGHNYFHLAGNTLSAEQLSELPLISVAKETSARKLIDRWFQEQGVFFQPAFSVQTSSGILPFVMHNLGIGIVPEFFAAELLSQKKILQLHAVKPFCPRSIHVLHRADSPLSTLLDEFLLYLLS